MSSKTTSVIRRYVFRDLPRSTLACISAGRSESARVWSACRDAHLAARQTNAGKWPWRDDLQKLIKGQFALHSQSAQMVAHAFLANVKTTLELRQQGNKKARYPWRDKSYYPLLWPKQAVAVQGNHIILPMGRGRPSIVLPKPNGFVIGGCKLIWNGEANELQVTVEVPVEDNAPGSNLATVDLGQIHQCAVTTSDGGALIVSGRGIRSLKRLQNKMHGEFARKLSRCKKGSRRYKKLCRARHRNASRLERKVRDLNHKGTRAVVDFCIEHSVGSVFVGDPHGVRRRNNGKKHNQRMAQWEYGRDKSYLAQKLSRVQIACSTGSERGTSSRCPRCGNRHKPSGRWWRCKACGFQGHRDLVGSVNMHEDNFTKLTQFPSLKDVTYLRPGVRSFAQANGFRLHLEEVVAAGMPATGRGNPKNRQQSVPPALLSERHEDTTCQAEHRNAGLGRGPKASGETGRVSEPSSPDRAPHGMLKTEAHPL